MCRNNYDLLPGMETALHLKWASRQGDQQNLGAFLRRKGIPCAIDKKVSR
jgi:hypothetical protein